MSTVGLLAAAPAVWGGWLLANVGPGVGAIGAAASLAALGAAMVTAVTPRARRRLAMAVASMLAILITATTAWLAWPRSNVHKTQYVASNRAILATLPLFPGARRLAETDAPYYKDDSRATTGYTSLVRYRLPAETGAAAVRRYFQARLDPGWRLVEIVQGTRQDGPVLNFRRGRSSLSINLMNARRDEFEITVDERRYRTTDTRP